MWIFGYGSLVWKADFPYVKKIIGYVKGYERKFWQASIDHRGVPERPGRVVTLIPSNDPESKVWGIAYQISDTTTFEDQKNQTMSQLDEREKRFDKILLQFYPMVDIIFEGQNDLTCVPLRSAEAACNNESVEAMAYIANPQGPLFLGDATVQVIAQQAFSAVGPSGPNSEYIIKLADFMRNYLPTVDDSHLFSVEQELLKLRHLAKVWGAAYKIHPRNVENVVKHLDMREVMGYEKMPVDFYALPHHSLNLFDVETTSSTSIISEKLSNSSLNGHIYTNEKHSNNGTEISNGHVNGTYSHSQISNENISNGSGVPKVIKQNGTEESNKNGSISIRPQSSSETDSDEEEQIDAILDGNVTGHFHVTMYYGNSENPHFIGPASMEEMASQIYTSSGPSGTNREYLYNLADAMRQICEDAIDPHLAELEMRVRKMEISQTKRRSGRSTPIEL